MRGGVVAVAALTGAWCALWGSASPANLLSGVLLSAVVVATTPARDARLRLRPVPLVRLGALIAHDFVVSTFHVGWAAITIQHPEDTVVEVELPEAARGLEVLLIIAVTLTPGTAVVDVDEAGRLWIHVLDRSRRPESHVVRLAELAAAALGRDPGDARQPAKEGLA